MTGGTTMCVCGQCEASSGSPKPLIIFLLVSACILGVLMYFSWVEQCEMGNERFCSYIEKMKGG